MAVTDHYDFQHLDPDEEISDFPSMWNFTIDEVDEAIHEAATNNVAVSRVPKLPASQIDSGKFAQARIPNLPASQITTGEFADARIPDSIARTSDVDDATSALDKRVTDNADRLDTHGEKIGTLETNVTDHGDRLDDLAALKDRIKELEDDKPYWSGWRLLELPERFDSGKILISRYGNVATLRFEQVEINGIEDSTEYEYLTESLFIPDGFRPKEYTDRPFGVFGGSYANYSAYIGIYQQHRLFYFRNIGDPIGQGNARASGELRYTATDKLPTTLPGDPA